MNVLKGVYNLHRQTARSRAQLIIERHRQNQLHKHRDFWAKQFASLSLGAFKTNVEIGRAHCLPSFDQRTWRRDPNARVWASSMSVTRDNFCNRPHQDIDASECAFGMFALANRTNGRLVRSGDFPLDIHAVFSFPEYGVFVLFHRCDGVVEMVWNVRVLHNTLRSVTKCTPEHHSKPLSTIPAWRAPITRFGSSCQISKKIVSLSASLRKVQEVGGGLDWSLFRDYDQEYETRWDTSKV